MFAHTFPSLSHNCFRALELLCNHGWLSDKNELGVPNSLIGIPNLETCDSCYEFITLSQQHIYPDMCTKLSFKIKFVYKLACDSKRTDPQLDRPISYVPKSLSKKISFFLPMKLAAWPHDESTSWMNECWACLLLTQTHMSWCRHFLSLSLSLSLSMWWIKWMQGHYFYLWEYPIPPWICYTFNLEVHVQFFCLSNRSVCDY